MDYFFSHSTANQNANNIRHSSLHEIKMDDMFGTGRGSDDERDQDESDDDNDLSEYSAANRFSRVWRQ